MTVLADQLTASIPGSYFHLPVDLHPELHGASPFTPLEFIRLTSTWRIVNLLHAGIHSGLVWIDCLFRMVLALLGFVVFSTRITDWFSSFIWKAFAVFVSAACVSQAISFITRGGVVDPFAWVTPQGRLIAAFALSDFYVPLALLLITTIPLMHLVRLAKTNTMC
jgi:hypothetical protein